MPGFCNHSQFGAVTCESIPRGSTFDELVARTPAEHVPASSPALPYEIQSYRAETGRLQAWDDTGVDIVGGGWTLLHWVLDGATRTSRLYRDGAEVGTFAHPQGIFTTGTTGRLGNAPDAWGVGNANPVPPGPTGRSHWPVPLAGILDEVRLATVARSAAWVATEYANQSSSSTFDRIGDEELVPD